MDVKEAFGKAADASGQIDGIEEADKDICRLILQHMPGESYDLVKNARRGHELEAYRRLARNTTLPLAVGDATRSVPSCSLVAVL